MSLKKIYPSVLCQWTTSSQPSGHLANFKASNIVTHPALDMENRFDAAAFACSNQLMTKFEPQVIVLAQQKGGVGKTTIAINLAAAFVERGEKVLLVDADVQQSARMWAAHRMAKGLKPLCAVERIPMSALHREIPARRAQCDRIIVDTAPVTETPEERSAIAPADLVLMPVAPSPLSVWSVEKTLRTVREARQHKPDLAAAFIINLKVANTKLGKDIAAKFTEQEFAVLDAHIRQLSAYPKAIEAGRTVFELVTAFKAASDMRRLASEILTLNQRKTAA